jgi:hypothetical protein
MSWCGGEITTGQLVQSLTKFAIANNLEYLPLEIVDTLEEAGEV